MLRPIYSIMLTEDALGDWHLDLVVQARLRSHHKPVAHGHGGTLPAALRALADSIETKDDHDS
jgi:hypothetical protein